jgi:ankyrin repeat protein
MLTTASLRTLEMLLESWDGADTSEEHEALLSRRDKELERAENLAKDLVSLGNVAGAEKLFKSSLNCLERMSGHEEAKEPRIAILNQLADLYSKTREMGSRIEMLEKAITLMTGCEDSRFSSNVESLSSGYIDASRQLAEFESETISGTHSNTALHRAIAFGNTAVISFLLKHDQAKQYLEARDKRGRTPLMLAVEGNSSEIVKILATPTARITPRADEETALELSIRIGSFECFCVLFDAEEKDLDGTLSQIISNGNIRMLEWLLSHRGVDLNTMVRCPEEFSSATPLGLSILRGQLDMTRFLIQKGADLRRTGLADDSSHQSALSRAVSMNDLQTVELLLTNDNVGIDDFAYVPGKFRRITPLGLAIYKGFIDVAKLLIRSGADCNKCADGCVDLSPLTLACKRDFPAAFVQLLLTKGSDPNNSTDGILCRTALQVASARGHEEAVECLITEGADVNAHGPHGTALEEACKRGQGNTIKLLLSKGALMTTLMSRGALQEACRAANPAIINLLLQRGANPNSPSGPARRTALQVACKEAHRALEKLKRNGASGYEDEGSRLSTALVAEGAIIELLFNGGADINAPQNRGILQEACLSENLKVVEILISHGANVNATDEVFDRGSSKYRTTGTPLQVACSTTNSNIVQLLLSEGANPNAQTNYSTPLQNACRLSRGDIVEGLLKNGANVNPQTSTHETPLQEACAALNPHIVEQLLRRHPDINATSCQESLTPLQITCGAQPSVLAERALERIAPLDATCEIDVHAIQENIAKNQIKVVELLLNHDPAPRTEGALGIAVMDRHRKVVEMLLDRGAHVDEPCLAVPTPCTSLDYVLQCSPVNYPGRQAMIEFLRMRGARTQEDVDFG